MASDPDPLPILSTAAQRFPRWSARLAYVCAPEAATWELTSGAERRFLKVQQLGWEPALSAERERMVWARSRLPVPLVLEYGSDADLEWMLTAALPGEPGTAERLRSDPGALVSALARGLRALHDTPATDCPFTFRLDEALAHVRARLAAGKIDPLRHFHPEHAHLSPDEALARLEHGRPHSEDVVLCHGDYCPPNALVHDGAVRGYVDLGALGLADRWWDLAVATWSVAWNFGAEWETPFLDSYGIAADPERMAYYRLLYDLAA